MQKHAFSALLINNDGVKSWRQALPTYSGCFCVHCWSLCNSRASHCYDLLCGLPPPRLNVKTSTKKSFIESYGRYFSTLQTIFSGTSPLCKHQRDQEVWRVVLWGSGRRANWDSKSFWYQQAKTFSTKACHNQVRVKAELYTSSLQCSRRPFSDSWLSTPECFA